MNSLESLNPIIALAPPTLVFHAREERPSGTDGGSSVIGWNIRQLNTVKKNTMGVGAVFSSPNVTIAPGDYFYQAMGVNNLCNQDRMGLYNLTDGAFVDVGLDGWANGSTTNNEIAHISGFFTVLLLPKTYQLQQYFGFNRAGIGQGNNTNIGQPEVYSELLIWRLN